MYKYFTFLMLSASICLASAPFDIVRESAFKGGISCFAAMPAIAVAFDGFQLGSDTQTGKTPKEWQCWLRHCRQYPYGQYLRPQAWHGHNPLLPVVPFVGCAIGLQNMTESASSHYLAAYTANSYLIGLTSASIAAMVSVLPYTWFNDVMTDGPKFDVWESTKRLSPKKFIGITGRETAFCGSVLVASEPMTDAMKMRFGDTLSVALSSRFMVGAMGSLAGQIFHNWAFGSVTPFAGALPKMIATGWFNVFYQEAKSRLK